MSDAAQEVVQPLPAQVGVEPGGDEVVPKFKDLTVHAWCQRQSGAGKLSIRARPNVEGTEQMTLEKWEAQDDTSQSVGVFCASLKFKAGISSTELVDQWGIDEPIGPYKYVVIEYGGAIVALEPVEFV